VETVVVIRAVEAVVVVCAVEAFVETAEINNQRYRASFKAMFAY